MGILYDYMDITHIHHVQDIHSASGNPNSHSEVLLLIYAICNNCSDGNYTTELTIRELAKCR